MNKMLSLYIHIPYCVRKCPYCGFYSTQYTPDGADDFVHALAIEAARYQAEFRNRHFHTIYLGGGTPTALSKNQICKVLDIVRNHFEISKNAEITVEANPNTITKDILDLLLERGANRLSIGVQSYSEEVLHKLGRLHTSAQAEHAFLLARSSGFKNIGMDLIYGIPGQTAAQWVDTLKTSIRCMPEHVSIYSLSLDEGSLFHELSKTANFEHPDDDSAAEMYEHAITAFSRAGYHRYEISNLSLPGFECRHNKNYWARGEYLGLGPGAWSFISHRRYRNIADAAEYARRLADGISPDAESEQPGPEQASQETIFLSLRTAEGLDLQRYQREYGPIFSRKLEENMAPLVAAGLLAVNKGKAILTKRGILLSNEALVRLSA